LVAGIGSGSDGLAGEALYSRYAASAWPILQQARCGSVVLPGGAARRGKEPTGIEIALSCRTVAPSKGVL